MSRAEKSGVAITNAIAEVISVDLEDCQGNVSWDTFSKNFTTNFGNFFHVLTNQYLDYSKMSDEQFSRLKKKWKELANQQRFNDIYQLLMIQNEMDLYSFKKFDNDDILNVIMMKVRLINIVLYTYKAIYPNLKLQDNVVAIKLWTMKKIYSLMAWNVELASKQEKIDRNTSWVDLKNDVTKMLRHLQEQNRRKDSVIRNQKLKKCIYAYSKINEDNLDVSMDEVLAYLGISYDEEFEDLLYCCERELKNNTKKLDENVVQEIIEAAEKEQKKEQSNITTAIKEV